MRQVTQAGQGASLPPAQQVLLGWYQPLARAMKLEQKAAVVRAKLREKSGPDVEEALRNNETVAQSVLGTSDTHVGPHLLLLSPQSLAVIVMHELLSMSLRKTAGVPYAAAALDVGRAVQAEVNIQ